MENILEQVNWEEKYRESEIKITKLEALIKFYEEQFRLAKHRQYGKSSEKTENPLQLSLFNEPEAVADKKEPEPKIEEITYSRKKRVGKREEDFKDLPVETIIYELPESEQNCKECGEPLHRMSQETRRELTVIPAQVKVTEHVQYIYACRSCEKNNDHVPVIKVSAPEPVIKGSAASPSAVAHIMTQKYVNAVPLYRQEQGLLREGVNLSRQTMANWMVRCAQDWLVLIYIILKTLLLEEGTIHADETVLQVIHEEGKSANTNSYEWLYRTSGCALHPIILYEYKPTRSSAHPKAFLKGFNGYLHTDGYSGYHCIDGITVVGCWAHVRRKFDEALKALPQESRAGSDAETGLNYCNCLFELERAFADLSPDERYRERLKKSKPVSDAFFAWVRSVNALPKMALGKAVGYAIEQRPYLENVFLDGRLELSNNRAERSIKPFVIGRKNWLFSNTARGAESSSIIYSIIETAKENGLNPFLYIKFLLETLPNTTTSNIENLLPWNPVVVDACK
jgi:transposase